MLFNFNGSDRPTDDVFTFAFINSQSKSICSMEHILLLCELMKTNVNTSSVGRSEPLKLNSTAYIFLQQILMKIYFCLPIHQVDGISKHRMVINICKSQPFDRRCAVLTTNGYLQLSNIVSQTRGSHLGVPNFVAAL